MRLFIWFLFVLTIILAPHFAKADPETISINSAKWLEIENHITELKKEQKTLHEANEKLRYPCGKVTKKGWTTHEKMQKALNLSCDKTFVLLLEAENGSWDETIQHKNTTKTGKDWGLCGINDFYHPKITTNPNFFNFEWQLKKCYELYKNGTTFYGLRPAPMKRAKNNLLFETL